MKRQQGFALVEVLIAIVIISIGMVAVAGVFIPATANYSNAADYTAAVNLAQKQLELLKTWKPDNWKAAGATIVWQDDDDPMPINLNGIDYMVETKKVSPSSVSNSLVEVNVTVSWSRGGKGQSIQLVAYYSQI